jgi:hypothetical protein
MAPRLQKVFSEEESKQFPESKKWDHKIDFKDENDLPPNAKAYPLSPKELDSLKDWLAGEYKLGRLRDSESPVAAPFFFVAKKDGKLRPVQDYRKLNDKTIKNAYPLPRAQDLIDKLTNATLFSKMDVRWGYNNIRIREGDQWKAAFKTPFGHHEPLVMYFRMTNSPATFQTMMDEILKDLKEGKVVVVYIDDILVFTNKGKEHHCEVVREVLQRLQDHDLFLKPEKCSFKQEKVEFLGMIIEKGKVSMDPVKVEGVKKWPTPTCVKDIQAFMGFANFYRRFILGFSNIARPMNDLLRKGVKWNWGEKQQKAFDELKERFTSAPILVMPDSEKKHKIEVDASDYATGGVLSQEMEDGLWHPVAYYSKSMNDAEHNYEIYDKELLAVIRALEEWHHYIQGATHPVEIWTDHKNLEYFMMSQKLTRRQARWSLLLAEYEFMLNHRPGVQNDKADRLSRRSDHEKGVENDNSNRMLLKPEYFQVNATRRGQVLVQGEKTLLKEIRECTEREPEVMQALENLKKAPIQLRRGLEEWNMEDGLVMFRGLVYVPNNKEIRQKILKLFHDSPAAGHPGRAKTLELVS